MSSIRPPAEEGALALSLLAAAQRPARDVADLPMVSPAKAAAKAAAAKAAAAVVAELEAEGRAMDAALAALQEHALPELAEARLQKGKAEAQEMWRGSPLVVGTTGICTGFV